MTKNFEAIYDQDNPLSSEELNKEVADIDFSDITEEATELLKGIIRHDNFDENVFKTLLQMRAVPFDKLHIRTLQGLAVVEIKTIEVFLLAVKRLTENSDFKSAIKKNILYFSTFINMQKQAIDDFNNVVALRIEELRKAATLEAIENILVEKDQLISKRKELLEQYPEDLLPEKKLLEISVFIEAAQEAKEKIVQLNDAVRDFEEKESLLDDLYEDVEYDAVNNAIVNNEAYTIAWKNAKKAGWKVSSLSFNQNRTTDKPRITSGL